MMDRSSLTILRMIHLSTVCITSEPAPIQGLAWEQVRERSWRARCCNGLCLNACCNFFLFHSQATGTGEGTLTQIHAIANRISILFSARELRACGSLAPLQEEQTR